MAKIKSKFGETHYSNVKEFLNAVITSNGMFIPKKGKFKHLFKMSMISYAIIIFIVTILSLAMLALTQAQEDGNKVVLSIIEIVVFAVLIMDFSLRWYTAEVKIKKGNWSYFIFPFTFIALVLLTSLLPSLYLIGQWSHSSAPIWETFKHMKFLRIFRIILLVNIIPGMQVFSRVLSKEKQSLYVVFGLVLLAIILFALVIFNIEKDKPPADGSENHFKTFWDSIYYSTITLTTIGFGDKTPVTEMGQVVTVVMAIVGIAILAIPSGIIAGGFIQEMRKTNAKKEASKLKKITKRKTKK